MRAAAILAVGLGLAGSEGTAATAFVQAAAGVHTYFSPGQCGGNLFSFDTGGASAFAATASDALPVSGADYQYSTGTVTLINASDHTNCTGSIVFDIFSQVDVWESGNWSVLDPYLGPRLTASTGWWVSTQAPPPNWQGSHLLASTNAGYNFTGNDSFSFAVTATLRPWESITYYLAASAVTKVDRVAPIPLPASGAALLGAIAAIAWVRAGRRRTV